MDRLKELELISERLDGTTVCKKNVWIVMDKTHKMILKGAPHQDKYMVLVSDIKDRKRVAIYNSENAARNAFTSYIYPESGVVEYANKTYGSDSKLINCLEVIKAINIIKI